MVKIDNLNNQTNNKQTETCGFDNRGFETQNNQTQTKPQAESSLIKTIGQLLPLAPFVYEQFTGQKVPQMSGTIAEIQSSLLLIQTNLQTIANNQQALNQRLIQLETSASQQLNNLTNQFKSLRLTHTKERKEIEYNNPPNLENQEENY